MNFQEIKEDIKNRMSEKRFTHTCGVIDKAEELAKVYNVDTEAAKLAALIHDVAKELTSEEVEKYCKENDIELGEIKDYPKIIHSHLGACIAQNEYGIEAKDILNAIKYHTTGRPEMSILEKVVYLADFLDDNRDRSTYEETYNKVKELAFSGKIDEAMKFTLEKTIMFLKGNIYIDTVNAFSYYNK